jgi:AcrR family transcriptional regulator
MTKFVKTIPQKRSPPRPRRDHRVIVAENKRTKMRARLLEATTHVFAERTQRQPVIEDVVRLASVSRGTFYKYFTSLDEALVETGKHLSDQFTVEILPVYDVLTEPWQRFAVGFRLFLTRAMLDHAWAAFVTRMDVWPRDSLVARYMSADLALGKDRKQFMFDDLNAATALLMGATAGMIEALRRGVQDPTSYIDAAVRMALRSLSCSATLSDKGVRFSRDYLKAWKHANPSATQM